jgi:hypothetical protein
MLIQPRIIQSELAAAILAGTYFAVTDKLKLYNNTFVPTPASVLADFDAKEAAFTGYAPVVLSTNWITGLDANGDALLKYPQSVLFQQSGTAAVDTVAGWYIVDTDDTVLKLAGTFDNPFPFDTTGNKLLMLMNFFFSAQSAEETDFLYGP